MSTGLPLPRLVAERASRGCTIPTESIRDGCVTLLFSGAIRKGQEPEKDCRGACLESNLYSSILVCWIMDLLSSQACQSMKGLISMVLSRVACAKMMLGGCSLGELPASFLATALDILGVDLRGTFFLDPRGAGKLAAPPQTRPELKQRLPWFFCEMPRFRTQECRVEFYTCSKTMCVPSKIAEF
ncbi:unnamed protein product [Symbiodinium sp. CCMP2456]|nr:unnamed protein product [Symbiodinium sp. CCMP2456]